MYMSLLLNGFVTLCILNYNYIGLLTSREGKAKLFYFFFCRNPMFCILFNRRGKYIEKQAMLPSTICYVFIDGKNPMTLRHFRVIKINAGHGT